MAGFWATCCALLLSVGSVAADTWPFEVFKTRPEFNPPDIEILKNGVTDPGYLFIGPRGNIGGGISAIIYDEEGNVVYQGPNEVTANFKVQKLFNQDVITFWAGNMMELGFGYGTVHILDNTYREIYTIRLQDNFLTPDGQPRESYIDLHESHITERNTLLVTAYNVTHHDLSAFAGDENSFLLTGHFYEIDIATNEIVHSWSTYNQPKMEMEDTHFTMGNDLGAQDRPWDAWHINSVELMDEGYMISLRHFWSGYYIHNNGTVMWQLSGEPGKGDFEVDEDAQWSWQHDIRVFNQTEDGMVIDLFNNANTPQARGQPTNGLSLYVDFKTRRVSKLRSIADSGDDVFSVSQGSYQLMSQETNHVFMGYGSISKVKEFDGDGNAVLTAQFGDLEQVASYRAYKCQWKATPFWKPDSVAFRTSTVVEVYMSWNGATEYDNWAVYSVPSDNHSDRTLLTTVKRTGFETRVEVDPATMYIIAVAQKGDVPLSTTDAVPVQPAV